MKKYISMFISVAILFTLAVPISATDNPLAFKNIPTSELLNQFKEASSLTEYSNEGLLFYIGEIVSRNSEFSDEELISIISNNTNEVNFRRGLLEAYLSKYDFIISDNAFLDMLQDLQFDNGLKILIIACLDNAILANSRTQNILFALSNASDGEVAYHAIKALSKVDIQSALEISTNIVKNLNTECEEKVNIALNLLAENLVAVDMSTIDNSDNASFVKYLCDVYQTTESEEIKIAVQTSLDQIDTEEANLALNYLQSITPQPYADGVGGYIAYRDGVEIIGSFITNWHTAIAVGGAGTSVKFAQATGGNNTTGIVDYNSFLDNNNFLGYYQPASESYYHPKRDIVVSTAKTMANLHIPYIASTCISYNYIPLSQTHYRPSDIKAIRCDGFVEYCLEYNGIRVGGPDLYWDISLRDSSAQDVHYGVAALTPKKQCEDYMVKVNLNSR